MKEQALLTCPDQYKGGFNAIIAETRACPTQTYGDYFSDWRGVENTHKVVRTHYSMWNISLLARFKQ